MTTSEKFSIAFFGKSRLFYSRMETSTSVGNHLISDHMKDFFVELTLRSQRAGFIPRFEHEATAKYLWRWNPTPNWGAAHCRASRIPRTITYYEHRRS